jgi:hypothetical protein
MLLESLTEAPVREWINVEIPNARMIKLDLVAWLTDGACIIWNYKAE